MKEEVLQFLQKEINQRHIPGAVVKVSHRGEVILNEAVGYRSISSEEKQPMQLDTVFDLASLTKVVATLPSVLKLVDVGEIALDDPVSYFLPDFSQNRKEEIRLIHLLTHSSGLTAHREFFKEGLTTKEVLRRIYQEELEYSTGKNVIYSDLGFILLYKIIEKVSSEKFDAFVKKYLLDSLEMTETGFLPKFPKERYAATEYSEHLGGYKFGVVHDDNTESMGGVSGHAGLFSTVSDLTNYASMIENDGVYNGKRILSSSAIKLTRKNYTSFSEESRGLGWMIKSPRLTSCGDYFSDLSYGHTGFTGTSIWFDPTIDLNVILLTNRVHFGREPHVYRLRPRLHNIIRSHFD